MNRVLLVAQREFFTNLKRRSFLFTAFGLPVLIIAVQFALGYFVERQSKTTGTLGTIGYVDLTPARILSRSVNKPEEFRPLSDEGAARQALVDGQIGAYFVVPSDYVESGIVHAYAVRDIPRGIEGQMAAFLTDNLLADTSPERATRLTDPINLTIGTVDSDKEIAADESALVAILLPIIVAMIFMMSVFTTSGFLLQGVVEEKEDRLMEILATSITPVQMLWGKILGLAGLGLVQVAVWGAAGALLLSRGSSIWSGLANVSIPTPLIVFGPLYLLLGYLLFGALLAGIGAAVTSMQEGQQISGIVSLIAAVPVLLSVSFFSNANGTVPTILSLVPFTAPIAMVMRIPLADVPVWQIGLSLLLLVAGTLLVVWIAAQVFRLGLLMYGKRLGLRTLSAALRQGLDIVAESPAERA